MIKRLRETFRPESSYKAFFITIITFALAQGLYKGIIDNYLAESVGMSAFDKGVSEFFREMPGLEEDVITLFPAAETPYTMLIAAISLSA